MKSIKYSKASEITFNSLPEKVSLHILIHKKIITLSINHMTKSPIILQTSPFPNNGYTSENQKST